MQTEITQYISPTKKLIDLTYLRSVSDNDETFVKQIIEDVALQLPEMVKELEDQFRKNGLDRLKAVAHKMNTTMMTMGMRETENLLHKIEEFISLQKNLDSLQELILAVKNQCNMAALEMDSELQNLQNQLNNK